jgi:hypothetical protein
MARGFGKKRAPGAASLLVGMLLLSVHAAQARGADEAHVCPAAPGPMKALVTNEQRQSASIELVAEPTPAFAAAPKATKSCSSWSAFLKSVLGLVDRAATHLALVVGSALLLSAVVPARGSAARSSAWCVVRYLLVSDSLVRAAAPQGVARFSSKGRRADVSAAAPGAAIAERDAVLEVPKFMKSALTRRRLDDCVNDDSTTDSYGDTCSDYYDNNPSACGGWDDSDFTASVQCCACGGSGLLPGGTFAPTVTPKPTLAPTHQPSVAPSMTFAPTPTSLPYEYAPTENAMPYCRLQNPSVCWGNTYRFREVTANGPFDGIYVGSYSAPALGDFDGDGTLKRRP